MCIFGTNPTMIKGKEPYPRWSPKSFAIPDELPEEAIIAWRRWGINTTQARTGRQRMVGDYGGGWYPGEVMEVSSYSGRDAKLLPGGNNGIYAYKLESYAATFGTPTPGACWGEVLLWGDIAEYPTGYRAKFAYPLSLFVPAQDVARVDQWLKSGVYVNKYVGKATGADKYGYHAA